MGQQKSKYSYLRSERGSTNKERGCWFGKGVELEVPHAFLSKQSAKAVTSGSRARLGSRRGPKQKRRKRICTIPPMETGLYEEGESLESEFEELQGEILESLYAWMDKEAKEKGAFQNCTLEESGHSTRKDRRNVLGLQAEMPQAATSSPDVLKQTKAGSRSEER
ncbi:hypothetical protein Syun_031859 [Stephania yunnanensis]|uniref:Uncharacterized protein n=1 Tax=Stephania yunnanensis TaxID=152371 RepID=A0AAP0DWT4_9MAGN